MVFIPAGASAAWIATLTDPQAMRQAAGDQLDAWRKLDVAVLHRLIVDKALRPWWIGRLDHRVHPQPAGACWRLAGPAQRVCGRLPSGTALDSVEAIARAGASMPHKSTYFYPKLTTGWVLKPLE